MLQLSRQMKFSIYVLSFLGVAGLMSPFVANEKPVYVHYKGQSFFPAFSLKSRYSFADPVSGMKEIISLENTDWKKLSCDFSLWAPIPYSPGKTDKNNGYLNAGYKSPFSEQKFQTAGKKIIDIPWRFRHWLGTGKKGEDVLSGLIHGAGISLLVGFASMLIASFFGILAGALAGYFGNTKASLSRPLLYFLVAGIFFSYYYGFYLRDNFWEGIPLSAGICLIIILFFYFAGKSVERKFFPRSPVFIPADAIILKIMEVFSSVPRIFLIISLAAIMGGLSLFLLIIIIGTTSWVNIARLTRGEMLRVREMHFIEAAHALGYPGFRTIFNHALPNCIAPVLVAMSFSVASAIMIESGLSFLGIGIPPDIVTWGSALAAARENIDAWWLIVFPGLLIFITVFCCILLGEGVRDRMDPRIARTSVSD